MLIMLFGERESRCTKCRLGWKTAFLVIFRFCQKAKNWVIFEEFQQNRELVLGILSILDKQAF